MLHDIYKYVSAFIMDLAELLLELIETFLFYATLIEGFPGLDRASGCHDAAKLSNHNRIESRTERIVKYLAR